MIAPRSTGSPPSAPLGKPSGVSPAVQRGTSSSPASPGRSSRRRPRPVDGVAGGRGLVVFVGLGLDRALVRDGGLVGLDGRGGLGDVFGRGVLDRRLGHGLDGLGLDGLRLADHRLGGVLDLDGRLDGPRPRRPRPSPRRPSGAMSASVSTSAQASNDGRSGIASTIVASRDGSLSLLRRSKYSSMSALKRSTSNCTSSTRLFTEAACEDSSPSSRPLRVAMRLSVSSRMRAISALDQSRIPAMSSSDRLRRVAAPSVAPSRIDSVTSLASASICWSAWSRADDAVARIAADRSAISFDGFLGAAAGAAGASISTMRWDSSGSWVSVAAASVAAASGRGFFGRALPVGGDAQAGVDVGVRPLEVVGRGLGLRARLPRRRPRAPPRHARGRSSTGA